MKLNKSLIINLLVTILLVTALVVVLKPENKTPITFETKPITIQRQDGSRISFNVELAKTYQQKAQGLMFREKIDNDKGMLFLFDEEHVIHMWMKNTFIPLDMIFIGKDGKIRTIRKNATPHSLENISSGTSVIAVLEINAMLSEQLNIRENDLVLY
ncbi:MAG: hypothetical protein K0R98_1291 [Rickettsiaceae bacterium]|jgi:uncharacterized membrane protein (UPF0127 family)|nr:hypothetical protein [Rickettsiaceae bacterium]